MACFRAYFAFLHFPFYELYQACTPKGHSAGVIVKPLGSPHLVETKPYSAVKRRLSL
jgi:hypothetical protein